MAGYIIGVIPSQLLQKRFFCEISHQKNPTTSSIFLKKALQAFIDAAAVVIFTTTTYINIHLKFRKWYYSSEPLIEMIL